VLLFRRRISTLRDAILILVICCFILNIVALGVALIAPHLLS
jgi:hypothetical protein